LSGGNAAPQEEKNGQNQDKFPRLHFLSPFVARADFGGAAQLCDRTGRMDRAICDEEVDAIGRDAARGAEPHAVPVQSLPPGAPAVPARVPTAAPEITIMRAVWLLLSARKRLVPSAVMP
jgi:hypothetical protein